jgi:hypothetical protein
VIVIVDFPDRKAGLDELSTMADTTNNDGLFGITASELAGSQRDSGRTYGTGFGRRCPLSLRVAAADRAERQRHQVNGERQLPLRLVNSGASLSRKMLAAKARH